MTSTDYTEGSVDGAWCRPSSLPGGTPRTTGPAAQDSVELALRGIREFADEALEGYRRWTPTRDAVLVCETGAQAFDRFLAEAETGPMRELWSSPPEAKGTHSGQVYQRIRAVSHDVETLFTEHAALGLSPWDQRFLEPGHQRVTGQHLPASLLLGGNAGLVLVTDRPERVLLVRDRGLVGLMELLYRILWTEATDLDLFRRSLGDPGQDDLHHGILLCLSQGLKDEAAARRLDMSVRTYRRHVADLFRRLGATSRFQAGYQAAVRGLVPGGVSGASE